MVWLSKAPIDAKIINGELKLINNEARKYHKLKEIIRLIETDRLKNGILIITQNDIKTELILFLIVLTIIFETMLLYLECRKKQGK